jgi:hypothetical protein
MKSKAIQRQCDKKNDEKGGSRHSRAANEKQQAGNDEGKK